MYAVRRMMAAAHTEIGEPVSRERKKGGKKNLKIAAAEITNCVSHCAECQAKIYNLVCDSCRICMCRAVDRNCILGLPQKTKEPIGNQHRNLKK